MTQPGKNYELFVAKLQHAIIASEEITKACTKEFTVDKKITDRCGIQRQFDIYWEYEIAGLVYKTVIECKDYESKVSIEKIDAFIGKLQDLPGIKAVFATKTGYQSGAQKKADQHKIDLLIVREQNNSDWVTPEGEPLVRVIHITSNAIIPASISSFSPIFSKEWADDNKIPTDNLKPINDTTDRIFIEDLETGTTTSLQDYPKIINKLSPNIINKLPPNSEPFVYISILFKNAFLRASETYMKMPCFTIKYIPSRCIKMETEIDYANEIAGVIEYLQQNHKTSIMKDGTIHKNIFP